VREFIIGPDDRFTKDAIAYRAIFSVRFAQRMDIGFFSNEVVGTDRHIVILLHQRGSQRALLCDQCAGTGRVVTRESWSAQGDVKEFAQAYEGFHPDVRAVLEACRLPQVGDPRTRATAALEHGGRIVGDACRPMTPYMAQEERLRLRTPHPGAMPQGSRRRDFHGAFRATKRIAKPRTSRIQAISSANTWIKGETSTSCSTATMLNDAFDSLDHTSRLSENNRNATYRTGNISKRLTAAPSRFDCVRRGNSDAPRIVLIILWRSMAASGTVLRRD